MQRLRYADQPTAKKNPEKKQQGDTANFLQKLQVSFFVCGIGVAVLVAALIFTYEPNDTFAIVYGLICWYVGCLAAIVVNVYATVTLENSVAKCVCDVSAVLCIVFIVTYTGLILSNHAHGMLWIPAMLFTIFCVFLTFRFWL